MNKKYIIYITIILSIISIYPILKLSKNYKSKKKCDEITHGCYFSNNNNDVFPNIWIQKTKKLCEYDLSFFDEICKKFTLIIMKKNKQIHFTNNNFIKNYKIIIIKRINNKNFELKLYCNQLKNYFTVSYKFNETINVCDKCKINFPKLKLGCYESKNTISEIDTIFNIFVQKSQNQPHFPLKGSNYSIFSSGNDENFGKCLEIGIYNSYYDDFKFINTVDLNYSFLNFYYDTNKSQFIVSIKTKNNIYSIQFQYKPNQSICERCIYHNYKPIKFGGFFPNSNLLPHIWIEKENIKYNLFVKLFEKCEYLGSFSPNIKNKSLKINFDDDKLLKDITSAQWISENNFIFILKDKVIQYNYIQEQPNDCSDCVRKIKEGCYVANKNSGENNETIAIVIKKLNDSNQIYSLGEYAKNCDLYNIGTITSTGFELKWSGPPQSTINNIIWIDDNNLLMDNKLYGQLNFEFKGESITCEDCSDSKGSSLIK